MNFLLKSTLGAGVAAAVIATATIAGSHSGKDMDPAVAARHAQMQMIGYSIGILGAVAKGEMEFDAAMVNSAAANINSLAMLDRTTLWIEGTEQGAAHGSRAKAEIWSDPDGFAKEFDALAAAAEPLMTAADVDAVRANMQALGGSCSACHKKYRGPKNE